MAVEDLTIGELATHAGPIALAAFAGVFLGGIALSFFWKNFGPWQMLASCREECAKCQGLREADQKEMSRQAAELADLGARYEIMQRAMHDAGFGLLMGLGRSLTKEDK